MAQKVDKLKGIIFDKDGTLFDYAQVWETILKEGIALTFNSMGKSHHQSAKQAMLSLMGIDENGRCIPRGLVFTHRKIQILRRFLLYCIRYRVNAIQAIKGYQRSVKHSEVLLNEKLREMDFSVQQTLFSRLKQEGYHIGVITNDNETSTNIFLSLMGLEKMVDFIASRDSHYRRKPHSEAFNAFCSQSGLSPSQVAMVGDTITDMLFAKRSQAGYTIALLSGSNDKRRLERLSDIVYEDISSLMSDTRLFPR
ncbi:MAG: HAD family hydrolase [Sphaerochaeta sp.]